MTYKLRHVTVLLFALFLGAAAMYVEINPWLRILVAAFLLVPIIYGVNGLRIAPSSNISSDHRVRPRRFSVLRSEVRQLLDVVRLLNWLTVDLERGLRNEDDVKAEIGVAERRLDEILTEIRAAAGRSSGRDEVEEAGEGEAEPVESGEGDSESGS